MSSRNFGYEVIPQFTVQHADGQARLDLLIEGTMTAIEFDGLGTGSGGGPDRR